MVCSGNLSRDIRISETEPKKERRPEMKMEWESLLSKEMQIPREDGPASWKAYPVDAFERDYIEIINSRLFRNLQDKTQLFPLVRGGHVRTRLTHSLEVSSICKQLGAMIACNKKGEEYAVDFGENTERYARNFSTILSCAGLLHDIGNPPFGHFGEASIGSWFQNAFADAAFAFQGKPVGELLNEQMKRDLIQFEGNAEALRILFRAARLPKYREINISCATINTLIKYPVASLHSNSKSSDIRVHKWGYFLADKEKFEEVRSNAGVEGMSRYPLTWLLEAADDIAYMISDLEDSLRMNLFSIDTVVSYFETEIAKIPDDGDEFHELQQMATMEILNNLKKRFIGAEDEKDKKYAYSGWLEYVKNWLIYAAAYSFFRNYEKIMNGEFQQELLADGWYVFTADILKGIMKKYTYPYRELLKQELSGQKIIRSLLDQFVPAALCWEAGQGNCSMNLVTQKYLEFIPQKYQDDYLAARTGDTAYDLYLRLLMVVDYISGMTDTEAKETYQVLEGF